MKMIKDKNKCLKKINKEFKNPKIDNLEKIIEKICYYYNVAYPVILEYKIGYDLEIKILDNEYGIRIYKINIGMNVDDPILVELSDKNYTDNFKVYGHNSINIDKRIYKNNDKNIVIKKHMFVGETGNCYLIRKHEETEDVNGKIVTKNIDISYIGLIFIFKNKYLNAEISLAIPESYPFVENLFIQKLFESNIEITNIEILFYIIKRILICNNLSIKIKNNTEKGMEIIDYDNNKLLEFVRITGNQKIEYKDGYKELLVTKYETESIENKEFQKILKMIRS